MSSVWEVIKSIELTIEIPFHDFQDDDTLLIKGDELNKKDWGEIARLGKRFGLVLLNGQKKIMNGGLVDNRKITSLTAPELLEINEWAFCRCKNLKDVTIPKVQIIGEGAFSGCDSIEYIKLPASLKIMCDNPFGWCATLKAVDVDPGNPIYESIDGVLYKKGLSKPKEKIPYIAGIVGQILYCRDKTLKRLAIYPGGRKGEFKSDIAGKIGYGAFWGCVGLTGISLPNVQWIENKNYHDSNTFSGCDNLKRVHLPEMTYCTGNPFVGCRSLEWIETDPSNPAFESKDGVLYTKRQMTIVACPCAREGDFTNSEALFVGQYAFKGSGVASVSLPNVRVIDEMAFFDCFGLVCLSLPSASYIGADAFPHPGELCVVRLGESPVYSPVHRVFTDGVNECSNRFILLPETHRYDAPTIEAISFGGAAIKFINLSVDCEVKTSAAPSGVVSISIGDLCFLSISDLVGRLPYIGAFVDSCLDDDGESHPSPSERIDNFIDALRDCYRELINYGNFLINLQFKIDVSGHHDVHNRQRGFVYQGKICFLFEFLSDNSKEELSRFFYYDSDFEKLKECLNDDRLEYYWRRLIGLDFIRNKEVIADIRIDDDDDTIRKNEMRELIEKTAENLRAAIG